MAPQVKPDSSTDYTGPSVAEMIQTHTLANNVISRHNDACPVLGASELVLLRRFVNAPPSRHNDILQDCGMLGPAPEGRPNRHGSLVGYVFERNQDAAGGTGPGPAMLDGEIEELKNWFDSGAPDSRMVGACETGRGKVDENFVWRL